MLISVFITQGVTTLLLKRNLIPGFKESMGVERFRVTSGVEFLDN
jgi:hypothetical protein